MPNVPDGAPEIDPETAYADAPDMINEVGWVARTARVVAKDGPDAAGRSLYFLRKAALLDRIDLYADGRDSTAATQTAASQAARRYQKMSAPDEPSFPWQARQFVREQYSRLTHDDRHAAGISGCYAGEEQLPHG